MKINYNRLVELNSEAIKEDGREMTCYFVVQSGIEKIMNGEELVKELTIL
jgi:hypothetical protein